MLPARHDMYIYVELFVKFDYGTSVLVYLNLTGLW